MEVNSYLNCVNCCHAFESAASKCSKINIAVPVETIFSGPGGQQIQCQSIQILEISVRDILLEIYGLDFSQQSVEGQQLSVCSACSSNLANLYLAHRNFIQTRHVNSLLSEALARIGEIGLECREDRINIVEEEACNEIVDGGDNGSIEVVVSGISNCNNEDLGFATEENNEDVGIDSEEIIEDLGIATEESNEDLGISTERNEDLGISTEGNEDSGITAEESSAHGSIVLSILPISNTAKLTENMKTVVNPAVADQVIVMDVPNVPVKEPIMMRRTGVQPQNKIREFELPTPRPGVKVSIFKSASLRYPLPKGNPPYVCEYCSRVLKTRMAYRNHLLTHPQATATYLPCPSCNLEFQSLENLQQHRLLIHEYTGSARGLVSQKDAPLSNKNSHDSIIFTVRLEPGACEYPGCHFLSTNKVTAVDHYICVHSRCEDDIEQARQLGFGLIQFDVQQNSISQEIISRFTPSGSPPYNCEFCDCSELDSLKNFMDHLISRHFSAIKNVVEKQNLNNETETITGDVLKSPKDSPPPSFSIVFPENTFEFTLPDHQCPYCTKQVYYKNSWNPMRVHIREIHLWALTGKKFKCSKCPRVFERSYVAKSHTKRCGKPDLRKMKKKRQDKTHCCEKCGKSFTKAGSLKNHVQSRCGRTFTCEVCGLSFSKNYKLVSHMVSHATERPFFCEYCGRNYKSRHALVFHQKISHTEEGRLKYNEMMRMKNRRRKLAKQPNTKESKKQ